MVNEHVTQNATVKQNQNEVYKMIIIAQFIYEGTETHLVLSQLKGAHDHVWNWSLYMQIIYVI